MSIKKLIKVQVLNSEDILFEGDVDRISSFNEVGAFDVYPMHANFISIIGKQVTLYNNHKKLKELTFEQAVMKVKQDTVYIFLGMEVLMIDEKDLELTTPETPPKK
jgi:F0F1-type ATP synthase epsilon subunit